MVTPLFTFAMASTLATLVLAIAWSISMKAMKTREKSTPFECGFDPKHSARLPFSTRFFILAVLFLVFDVEIVLLLPTPLMTTFQPNHLIMLITFIIILIAGLFHEWREGSLEWAN